MDTYKISGSSIRDRDAHTFRVEASNEQEAIDRLWREHRAVPLGPGAVQKQEATDGAA